MKQIKGLSGLFPGPVVDGGRRAWDWNPNCRFSRERRWYAGFEGDDIQKAIDNGVLCTGSE